MKKFIVLLLMIPFFSNAQLGILFGGKNVIKTNISSLAINNYNITYERSFLKKMSLSVGVRYMPKSQLPLKSTIEKIINDPNVKINDFQVGNFAITPEVRFYLSAGKLKGFYIAPYARYATFDVSIPVTYDNPNYTTKPTVLFNGTIKSFSGGILLGTQFSLAKKLVLDFYIIGGHYGSSSGTINAVDINPAMNTPQEKQALQDQLDKFKEVGPFKFDGKVTSSTTATITSTGPWAGVRAAGLSLGLRF